MLGNQSFTFIKFQLLFVKILKTVFYTNNLQVTGKINPSNNKHKPDCVQ
jgi:hypothetical protein